MAHARPPGETSSGAADSRDRDPAAGPPLTLRRALLRIGVIAAIVAAVLTAGAANGVGPLAGVMPPDQVSDPREMLARSLQAVIDASSVRIDASVDGGAPGRLVGSADERHVLDGTTVSLDLRPQDARSHLVAASPALGIAVESLSRWDALAYRSGGGGWSIGSLGSLVGSTGIDANPLTLVSRLRTRLAEPGAPLPVSTDVPCGSPSGRCREVRLSLGSEPCDIVLQLLPGADAAVVGTTTTEVLLDADAATLRPVHLALRTRNGSGTLAVTIRADFSRWDWPSVIEDPPGG